MYVVAEGILLDKKFGRTKSTGRPELGLIPSELLDARVIFLASRSSTKERENRRRV